MLSVLCAFLIIKGEPKLLREVSRCIKLCFSHHLETRPGWNCPSSAGHHMKTGMTDPDLVAAIRAGLSSSRRSLLNQTMELHVAMILKTPLFFDTASYSSQLVAINLVSKFCNAESLLLQSSKSQPPSSSPMILFQVPVSSSTSNIQA
jgi:hypothetical protein